ncbi:MAG: biopolymer transporter ExbD [Bacteroidota bacterium]|jgi:biopolymer transport protein ExbD|nr:biopolymer transporter ExbD [Bacteroidota bacterium]MEC7083616.1 biopolymer transporter ExbD [Bacteroidota bacterium]MEC8004761.1 biopolymer transporter ExbD [Bacteroidota bacterium]MEC8286689.1 biopolymer transporter ExbD [Bacteroidota bacterium]MEC8407425.1 biopolymer transporter ExbD [Bacteroidota bacterium]|tara:strand:+ start:384 stop:770 length:387 start_codon:yes stop_codon:yes gene_type:complete
MRSSNKIKVEGGMSSMTDLVFLLLIFFIIISTFVNTSHQIQLPDGSGDPSLTSPVKVYVNAENQFFINSNEEPIQVSNVEREIMNLIGENKAIELLADKETHRASAYEIIRIAKQNALKVVVKTKGGK